MKLFNIETEIIKSSTIQLEGKSNSLLVNILKKIGASRYLSGVGARAYYEPSIYEQSGIEVTWQNFVHPHYPQLHGEFIPFLSSIDLLLNVGSDEAARILRETK